MNGKCLTVYNSVILRSIGWLLVCFRKACKTSKFLRVVLEVQNVSFCAWLCHRCLKTCWRVLRTLPRWTKAAQAARAASVQIDPKVSHMIRKCLRVCSTVILSPIGGLFLCFLNSWKTTSFGTQGQLLLNNEILQNVSRLMRKCHLWSGNVSKCTIQWF